MPLMTRTAKKLDTVNSTSKADLCVRKGTKKNPNNPSKVDVTILSSTKKKSMKRKKLDINEFVQGKTDKSSKTTRKNSSNDKKLNDSRSEEIRRYLFDNSATSMSETDDDSMKIPPNSSTGNFKKNDRENYLDENFKHDFPIGNKNSLDADNSMVQKSEKSNKRTNNKITKMNGNDNDRTMEKTEKNKRYTGVRVAKPKISLSSNKKLSRGKKSYCSSSSFDDPSDYSYDCEYLKESVRRLRTMNAILEERLYGLEKIVYFFIWMFIIAFNIYFYSYIIGQNAESRSGINNNCKTYKPPDSKGTVDSYPHIDC